MLNRIFGGPKKQEPVKNPSTHPGDFIKFYDNTGREMLIEKEEYRTKVLPTNLQKVWDKPEELYNWVVGALKDGFHKDVLAASEQLFKTYNNQERRHVIRAVVLKLNGFLDEAETILRTHIEKNGETSTAALNLAQVQAQKNNMEQAEKTLWRSIELDPNNLQAIIWWVAIQRERDQEKGEHEALGRIGQLPGSYRAHLWIGRIALEKKNLDIAKRCFSYVLSHGGQDHSDVLMTISGDLGNSGFINEIIEIIAPIYEPKKHGPQTGCNLLQAYLETKRHDDVGRQENDIKSRQGVVRGLRFFFR